MSQTNFGVPSIIDHNNKNFQHASNSNPNSDTSNINNINITTLQNITYEFYLPLPNDTRIYHVTYTELNLIEIALLLNNRIDLSHIPNNRLPYHYNVQRLIRQEIIQQSVGYQQNTIPQQSFDTMDIQPIFQEHPDDNAYDASSIPSIQQSLEYQQEAVPQQFFDNNTFEFYLPLPNDVYIYHVTYSELNSTEIAQLLNNRIDLSHIPDHRIPYHYNVQHLIWQQIVQQPVDYQQQDAIPQQSFDTMFQEYSVNNAYDIFPIQQPIQNTTLQQSFDTIDIQPIFQEYSNNNANDASSVPPNSPEYGYNGIQSHQNN
ncbi:hypothetical protein C1646_795469 [Rhizophagus diaphanus]|nr:hypothetical protein C1646_795469 [Rhizophagus diaphanus] [Rhizophagus sp. MUCL 43196]